MDANAFPARDRERAAGGGWRFPVRISNLIHSICIIVTLPCLLLCLLTQGREIGENENVVVSRSVRGQSVLMLTNITADDSGKYSVEVMNDTGYDIASASVAVEGPPEPPGGRPSVSQGPDRVAVAWCGPPYDGGCFITGFM